VNIEDNTNILLSPLRSYSFASYKKAWTNEQWVQASLQLALRQSNKSLLKNELQSHWNVTWIRIVDLITPVEPEVATVDDPLTFVKLIDDSKPWSSKKPINQM